MALTRAELDSVATNVAPYLRKAMTTTWFEQRRDYAPIFIRLFAGLFLIYMSQDNVFSWARMLEFEQFLLQFGFPLPLASAVVSVTCQFVAGVLFILGAFIRPAAAVMVINFIVALVMVHRKLPFREALDPCAMLASSLFLLFNGAGRPSVDAWRKRRRV
jgi:putative oxidoreductase